MLLQIITHKENIARTSGKLTLALGIQILQMAASNVLGTSVSCFQLVKFVFSVSQRWFIHYLLSNTQCMQSILHNTSACSVFLYISTLCRHQSRQYVPATSKETITPLPKLGTMQGLIQSRYRIIRIAMKIGATTMRHLIR